MNTGKIPEDIRIKLREQIELSKETAAVWESPDGDQVAFKSITRPLMKKIQLMAQDAEINKTGVPIEQMNDMVLEECVLWPKLTKAEWEELPVGTTTSILAKIQELSGLIDVDLGGRLLRPASNLSLISDFVGWGEPEDEEIEELKGKIRAKLFKCEIDNLFFVIRPVTKIDTNVVQGALDQPLALARCITVWPKEVPWDSLAAGVVEELGETAFLISSYDCKATVSAL